MTLRTGFWLVTVLGTVFVAGRVVNVEVIVEEFGMGDVVGVVLKFVIVLLSNCLEFVRPIIPVEDCVVVIDPLSSCNANNNNFL